MIRTPPQNGRQSLVEEDLPVDTALSEEKREAVIIMEEPSDGPLEKQKHLRRYGRIQTYLSFRNGQTALNCKDPNIKLLLYYYFSLYLKVIQFSQWTKMSVPKFYFKDRPQDRTYLNVISLKWTFQILISWNKIW